jgi:hypothetical protein
VRQCWVLPELLWLLLVRLLRSLPLAADWLLLLLLLLLQHLSLRAVPPQLLAPPAA